MRERQNYRADIDGLRAIAVLGVVAYHACPVALPGGFVGVDIFFIISGYLISGILFRSLMNGGFRFREFYARRVRRLFPALIVLLLLCLVYGFFILLRDEFRQLGMHVAAGTVFVQNIVFWRESGYFDVEAARKPLLHLWSLAVEEQFYIVFPPLLILFLKRKWSIGRLLWIMLVISFALNLLASYKSREAAFFLSHNRAWEFLTGSLLAWRNSRENSLQNPVAANILSIFGVLLLVSSMLMLDQHKPYPSWRAVFPVTGSIAIIAAGHSAWINKWVLSHPIAVWIGLISYPLYLFHWPALSFVHIVKGENTTTTNIVAALGVAFVLTVLTYYFVEKPLRFLKSRWNVSILVAAFIATGALGLLVWRKNIRANTTAEAEKIFNAINDKTKSKGWELKAKLDKTVLIYECGEGEKAILFVGDSTLYQYAPRIAKVIGETRTNRKAILMWAGGTPPIHDCEWKEHPNTKLLMVEFEKLLKSNTAIQQIVIAAYWDFYFQKESTWTYKNLSLQTIEGSDAALEEFGRMIRRLTQDGKKVSVVSLVPDGPECDPKEFCKRSFVGFEISSPPRLTVEEFLGRGCNRYIVEKLRSVVEHNGGKVIDPIPFLSEEGVCLVQNEQGPIRYDDHHLRSKYARDHVTFLDQLLKP